MKVIKLALNPNTTHLNWEAIEIQAELAALKLVSYWLS